MSTAEVTGNPVLQAEQITQASTQAAQKFQRQDRRNTYIGASMLVAGVGAGIAIASGALHDATFAQEMPFEPKAQSFVNGIDHVLEDIGEIAFPMALAGIGAVKISARHSPRIARIEQLSSREMTDDGNRNPGRYRKVMVATFAGGIALVPTAATALGTVVDEIGQEIQNGASRPLDNIGKTLQAIQAKAHPAAKQPAVLAGDKRSIITQSQDSMSMIDQYLPVSLSRRIQIVASRRGVQATPVDLNLSSFNYHGLNRTDLVFGADLPATSPAAWKPEDGCDRIPVLIDKAANVDTGQLIDLSNETAQVVGHIDNMSALGRIGMVADRAAVKTCLEKNPNTPDDLVLMNSNVVTSERILKEAEISGDSAVVISNDHYIDNSKRFWEANVKPITNFVDIISGGVAVLAMSGLMVSRLLRNRREWGAKFGAGVTENEMRATELLRSAKDGVVASVIGTTVATGVMPLFNVLESGMRAGVGFGGVMVGFAVGTVGSVGGAAINLIRPRKTINPTEHTRI